ncbi:DUF7527 domain-containing protein, partial [Halorubrum halodurans]
RRLRVIRLRPARAGFGFSSPVAVGSVGVGRGVGSGTETDDSESAGADRARGTEEDEKQGSDRAQDRDGGDGGDADPSRSSSTAEPESPSAGNRDAAAERGASTERDAAAERDPAGKSPDATTSPTGTGERTERRSESSSDRGSGGPSAPAGPADDDVFSEEEQWRETKSIPALDPSETNERGEDPSAASAPRSGRRSAGSASRSGGSTGSAERSRTDGTASPGPTDGRGSAGESSPSPRSTERSGGTAVSGRSPSEVRERIEELESALSSAESAREEVESERDRLEAERDELREELEDVRAERDELRTERERLEEELERLRAEAERLRDQLDRAESRLPEGERSLSAAEAREGTNLFVRYDSKGGATLEDAHDGTVSREELRENLRIEHHTSFETEGLLVDGDPFESFLRGTMEYGFTRWLVEELPFEVGETGNGSALRDLYDALPEIDRAEIGGSVSVVIRENGEEVREQRSFDLVLRDRMGNPLFVAELNDSRAPTAGATLESLVANGGVIAESNEAFAGAFAVTASFFEPDALEAASDAVGGGLFSRSKRKSFVKLSRKRGYHLCLVESREGGFHLTVPDL